MGVVTWTGAFPMSILHESLWYGAVNGGSPYLRMGVVTWTGAFPMSILHTKAFGMVQSMVVLHFPFTSPCQKKLFNGAYFTYFCGVKLNNIASYYHLVFFFPAGKNFYRRDKEWHITWVSNFSRTVQANYDT